MMRWVGDLSGGISIDGQAKPAISAKELVALANSVASRFSEQKLRVVGAAAFFAALRDYSVGRESEVLASARRAFDSLDPYIENAVASRAFHDGVAAIQDALFAHRSDTKDTLVSIAYAWLAQQISSA